MGRVDKTYYVCDGCKNEHESEEGMIWVYEIGHIRRDHTDLVGDEGMIFCNKTCLKNWIDEVL